MLNAYFDRSSNDPWTSMSVGGFISTDERWALFEAEWAVVLRKHGVECFRASDMEGSFGLYAGWTPAQRIAFQKDLIPVMQRHTLFAASACLLASDYESVICGDHDQEMPKKVGSPFTLLADTVVKMSIEWARGKYPGERVAFVFEQGEEYGEAADLLKRTRPLLPTIGPVAFDGTKELSPLQAADFHAYEAWKHAESWWATPKELRPPRKSLASLISGIPHLGLIWDAEQLIVRKEEQRRAA